MARVRSPAYPALSLPDAIVMIRSVHSAQQTTPEPRSVVLEHMGYSGESGRSQKAISALIKYGLLEKLDDQGLCVSHRAVSILYPDPDYIEGQYQELFHASREPQLFREMFERWDSKPTETSLEAFLIRKGFNTNAIPEVARAFYDTYDLVSGFNDSYDFDNADVLDGDEEEIMQTRRDRDGAGEAVKPPVLDQGIKNITKPVFDFETVKILTEIDNQEDLAELIDRLEKVKGMLPNKVHH